jgi:hypothetical protein
MIKRVRQEDLKKLKLEGKAEVTKPAPRPKKPAPTAPDHSAILSKMAGMIQASAKQQQVVLESMKALMEREPASADTLRLLTEALQGIHPPAPVAPPKPWGNLRFEIERDGNGTMRAVNVTRDGVSKRLN